MIKDKLLLVFVMLTFGSLGLFVRNMSFSSAQIAMARGLIGALFIFGYIKMAKQKSIKLSKRSWLILMGLGALIGINWVLLFQAYQYLTVSTATIIYYTAPILMVILGVVVLKEKVKLYQVMLIVVALIGLILVAEGYDSTLFETSLVGFVYALLAALFYATVITGNKMVVDVDPFKRTLIQLVGAGLILVPYVWWLDPISISTSTPVQWMLLVVLGVFHTGLAYTIYFNVVTRLTSQSVAMISYIDPLSAIFMATLFLSETMGYIQIIGATFILLSTFLSERFSLRKKMNKI